MRGTRYKICRIEDPTTRGTRYKFCRIEDPNVLDINFVLWRKTAGLKYRNFSIFFKPSYIVKKVILFDIS